MAELTEILCVDDEPQVVEGLKDLLDGRYHVHIATSGADGLDILAQRPNIAIIMSDMRMPSMDGAAFLQKARVVAPQAVRMLLTGYADMDSAMAAVNKGQIFRFLTKPWTPDDLDLAFQAAMDQYRLMTAEKVLLQQTLLGCLKALLDVLAVVEPIAFGRAQRLKRIVGALVEELRIQSAWPLEAAALLCQLGCIGMSDAVLLKLYEGDPLDEEDEREVSAGISNARKLLEPIPRLEPVLEILAGLSQAVGEAGPLGSRVLRVAMDFDSLEAHGYSPRQAVEAMRSRAGRYDPMLLDALSHTSVRPEGHGDAHYATTEQMCAGEYVAEDIRKRGGVLIVPRGVELTANVIAHIRKFRGSLEKESFKVSRRPEATAA